MVESQDLRIRSYEELLWDKVVKMSEAKEVGNDYFFDELLDETEMFLKLVPEMYQVFMENKNKFDTLVSQNLTEHKKLLISIEDDITRDLLDTQKKAIIKWEYRSDMLEMLLNLLNYFQMIPFTSISSAEMAGVAEMEPEEEIAEPTQPEPVPQATPQPIQQPPETLKPIPTNQQITKPTPSITPQQRPPAQIEEQPNMGKGVKLKNPKTD